jgi:DNA-binding CsgD family transcriptional regulator
LIRIAIVADTLGRARHLAALLADDERLDIVDVRASQGRALDIRVDVVVVIGPVTVKASDYHSPVVLISDARPSFGRNIRATLPVTASASEISAAIEAAANDLSVFTQEQVLRWIPSNENHVHEETLVEELTPRELEVLRMIADGSLNKEIARALGISEHTVKFHVAQILAKLNAGSRTEAVSLGIRRGLITI